MSLVDYTLLSSKVDDPCVDGLVRFSPCIENLSSVVFIVV